MSHDQEKVFRGLSITLGDQFIDPRLLAEMMGFAYSGENLQALCEACPNQGILYGRIKPHLITLIPGPPRPLSIVELLEEEWGQDLLDTGWYYDDDQQSFARDERINTQWYAVHHGPMNGSMACNWPEQQGLVRPPLYIPTAVELIWAVMVQQAFHNTWLLNNIRLRTASRSFEGNGVAVSGRSRDRRIALHMVEDKLSSKNLGLATAFRLT